MLLSYLFNHSERELYQLLPMHAGYLWFCGLDFEFVLRPEPSRPSTTGPHPTEQREEPPTHLPSMGGISRFEASNYEVTLHLPVKVTVAASGVPIEEKEENGNKRIVYQGTGMRDFILAISENFIPFTGKTREHERNRRIYPQEIPKSRARASENMAKMPFKTWNNCTLPFRIKR